MDLHRGSSTDVQVVRLEHECIGIEVECVLRQSDKILCAQLSTAGPFVLSFIFTYSVGCWDRYQNALQAAAKYKNIANRGLSGRTGLEHGRLGEHGVEIQAEVVA